MRLPGDGHFERRHQFGPRANGDDDIFNEPPRPPRTPMTNYPPPAPPSALPCPSSSSGEHRASVAPPESLPRALPRLPVEVSDLAVAPVVVAMARGHPF